MTILAGGFLSGLFGGEDNGSNSYVAYAATTGSGKHNKVLNSGKGPTSEMVKSVDGK